MSPVQLLMKDRSHSQIMFHRSEGVFNLRKLDIGIPQGLRIGFTPIGAKDIASPYLHSPAVALLVFLDMNAESVVFVRHAHREERGGPTVSFKESADLPLHLLLISYPALVGLLRQGEQLTFKPLHKAVEDGVFFFLPSTGATKHKGFIRPLG